MLHLTRHGLGNGMTTSSKLVVGLALAAAVAFGAFQLSNTARDRRWLSGRRR